MFFSIDLGWIWGSRARPPTSRNPPTRAHAGARAHVPAHRHAGARELRAGNAAAIPRQSHPKSVKKVRCGCPYVLESDPMLSTTLILTIFRSSTLSVMYNLHKPEFPHVGLPTQALSALGSVFPAQDDADATNAFRQPHPRREKCVEPLIPTGTFFSSRGPKDPHE